MIEKSDRRTQILETAFEEFAAKGYHGATIKSIAAGAGLRSPALIYWYFPDKEGLFRNVLSSQLPILQAVEHPEMLMKLPPKEALPWIGRAFIAFNQSNAQTLKLVVGEAVRRPEVAGIFVKGGTDRVLGFLEAYLERQIESGNLRPHTVSSSTAINVRTSSLDNLASFLDNRTVLFSLKKGGVLRFGGIKRAHAAG
jgi:AcrR family transcriptional regulator